MHQCLFILPIIFLATWNTRLTAGSPDLNLEKTETDSVILSAGFFLWDERTVLTAEAGLAADIIRYQEMVDHSNTDFSDQPESVIRLTVDPAITSGQTFIIEVSQDTIMVSAPSVDRMKTALWYLFRMKKDAERKSPDYGLIYIRCGLYRFENF